MLLKEEYFTGYYFCGCKRKSEKPQKFLPAKLNYDNYSFKEDGFRSTKKASKSRVHSKR